MFNAPEIQDNLPLMLKPILLAKINAVTVDNVKETYDEIRKWHMRITGLALTEVLQE